MPQRHRHGAAVGEIGARCGEAGIRFAVDASQTASVPIDVEAMNLDVVVYGPQVAAGTDGIGGLYVREGVGSG